MSEPRLALSVVVPAFEEQRRLAATLGSITSYLAGRRPAAEVIVVDDGSSDGTFEIASAWGEPVRALRLPRNQGKGAALRHGVLASRGERVLLCDADLSTPIEELEKLEAALAAGADLACGSRSVAGSQVRLRQARYRELMGRCFNL
jgi:dolichyl-phosphate beta-glucosyltransferase